MMRWPQWTFPALFALAFTASAEPDKSEPSPISMQGLQIQAETVQANFTKTQSREPLGDIQREVVSFEVDGLRQFALLLRPGGPRPARGWPVLLMNHGHHPDPPQYGRVSGGATDRPGDYYRGLPLAYAQAGFLVVVPDFRGHNESEGAEFARGLLESHWYARDSIGAFSAIVSLDGADTSAIFLWGHSMGGDVTLRVMVALGDRVRGASVWAASSGLPWEKGMRGNLGLSATHDGLEREKPRLLQLRSDLDALPFAYDPAAHDPRAHLDALQSPLMIQHSIHDKVAGTPFTGSADLAAALYWLNKPYELFSYDGNAHLFRDADRARAIQRDVRFFRAILHAAKSHDNGELMQVN